MKTTKSLLFSLFAATAALAEPPQIEIEARYEGFPESFFAEVHHDQKTKSTEGLLSAPRVTTKSGNTAVIEITREVQVPPAMDGNKVAKCGVTLEVTPDFKDGHIMLTGKSTVRHQLNPGENQPLIAVSFTARETFFSCTIANGKPLTLPVGNGPKDKSRITLTAELIEPASPPAK